MGKIKKENVAAGENGDVTIKEEDNYADKVKNANAIASPMASKKLTKKCYKLIKKGKKNGTNRRSLKIKREFDDWSYLLFAI